MRKVPTISTQALSLLLFALGSTCYHSSPLLPSLPHSPWPSPRGGEGADHTTPQPDYFSQHHSSCAMTTLRPCPLTMAQSQKQVKVPKQPTLWEWWKSCLRYNSRQGSPASHTLVASVAY